MNKKLLYGMLLPLFAIVLVTASALFYTQFTVSFNVNQPITIEGDEYYNGYAFGEDYACGMYLDEENSITVKNSADEEKSVTISTEGTDEFVTVNYLKVMEMHTKDSNGNITGTNANLYYTIIGENFVYKTEALEGYNLDDYVLVYSPDTEEGISGDFDSDGDSDFDDFTIFLANYKSTDCNESNNWCEGVDFDKDGSVDFDDFTIFLSRPLSIDSLVIIGNAADELTIGDLDGGLPIDEDFNDEAKLWLMLRADVVNGDWDIETILFGHNLVTYTHADSGTLKVPSKSSIEFYPMYAIDCDGTTGTYELTTTIA